MDDGNESGNAIAGLLMRPFLSPGDPDDHNDSNMSRKPSMTATVLLLHFAGLSVPSDAYFQYLSILLGLSLWVLVAFIFGCFVSDVHDDLQYNIGATIVWCLHSVSVFSIVAYDNILCGGLLEKCIWEMTFDDFLPGRCENLTDPKDNFKKMKHYCMKV